MQILYGNDGVNYRLIDKSLDMSDGIQKSMLATYSKYEFITNFKAYSSVDKEPETITYVTSNLDNQMSDEQLVVCKTGHMSQFSSPSYYFHGIVKEVSNEFYKKDFFEIFSYEFVRDIDVANYGNGSIEKYAYADKRIELASLTDEQLIVILASFMANEKEGKKTKILVDASGDAYNLRSREILFSIYQYLPYELRKRYGFKTYTQDERNIPARIAFVLFNSDETVDNGEYINLKERLADIEARVDAQYVNYAKYLVEGLTESERLQHFETLSRLAKNGRLKIDDCLTYYNNVDTWSKGTQEELLPEWIQYIDQNSFRKGPLYEVLLDIIVKRVENQYYNDYLFDNILKLYKENIYNLSPLAAKTIRFADCLEEIYIEPSRFSEWYRSLLQQKTERLNQTDSTYKVQLEKLYNEEITALKNINIMSDELTALLQTEMQFLREQCNMISGDIEQQKMQELERVCRQIASLDTASMEEFVATTLSVWTSIQFKENKRDISLTIEEWLDTHFKRHFVNRNELTQYYATFSKLQGIISNEKYHAFVAIGEKEKVRIENENKARVMLLEKDSILKNYCNLLQYLNQGVLVYEDRLQITIAQTPWSFNAVAAKEILEFLLYPSKNNQKKVEEFIPRLLEDFINSNIVTVEHLECLMAYAPSDKAVIKMIVEYYLISASPIKVSGVYVAQLLHMYHSDMADYFINLYEDKKGEISRFVKKLEHLKNPSSKSDDTENKKNIGGKIQIPNLFGGRNKS